MPKSIAKKFLLSAFCFYGLIASAQYDQLHISLYQFSAGKAELATNNNYSFSVKNPMLKVDWVSSDFGWVTGDFTVAVNIDWSGTVNSPPEVHGSIADVDFGFYLNPGKPIKILGTETRIGLGFLGGFETAGFNSGGITFPGASLSVLTKLGERFVINTRYHHSVFYNNQDSKEYGKNTKLQFNVSYKLLNWFGFTLSPNVETYKLASRPSGAAAKGANYLSLDLGMSFFW